MRLKSSFFASLSVKTALAAGFAGLAMFLAAIAISFFLCVFYTKQAHLKEISYSALAFARSVEGVTADDEALAGYAEDFGADYAFTFAYRYPDLKINNLIVSGGYYVSETELLQGLANLGSSHISVVELTPFDKTSYTAIYAKILGTKDSYGGLIFRKELISKETAKKFFPHMLWTLLLVPIFAAAGFWAGKNVAKEVNAVTKGLKEGSLVSYGADYKDIPLRERGVNLIRAKLISAHNEYHKTEERKQLALKELSKFKKQLDEGYFNEAVLLDSESMDLSIEREKLIERIGHCENLLIRDSGAAHGDAVALPFLEYFEGRLDAAHVLLLKGEYEEFFAQIPKMGEDISRMNALLASPSILKRLKFPELAERAAIFTEKLFKVRVAFHFSKTAKQFECPLEFVKVLASSIATFAKFTKTLKLSAETYSEGGGEKRLFVVLSAKRREGAPLLFDGRAREQRFTREILASVFRGDYALFEDNSSIFAEFRIGA